MCFRPGSLKASSCRELACLHPWTPVHGVKSLLSLSCLNNSTVVQHRSVWHDKVWVDNENQNASVKHRPWHPCLLGVQRPLRTSQHCFTVEFQIRTSLDQWHVAASKCSLLVLPVLPLQEWRKIYNMDFTTTCSQGATTAKLRMRTCGLIAH